MRACGMFMKCNKVKQNYRKHILCTKKQKYYKLQL